MSNARLRLDDPYSTIGFALKQAQQALRTHMDGDLRKIGLTTPQFAVLAYLKVEAGASNAMLARGAFVTPQTMQAILVTLEKSGLVKRTAHPDRRRIQMTELTALGRQALEEASTIVADAETRLREAAAPVCPDTATAMLLRFAEALRRRSESNR